MKRSDALEKAERAKKIAEANASPSVCVPRDVFASLLRAAHKASES